MNMTSLHLQAYSKPKSTPWKSIFTSKCVWGLFACHSADAFVQNLVAVILPTYLSEVFYFDVTQVSFNVICKQGITKYIVAVSVTQCFLKDDFRLTGGERVFRFIKSRFSHTFHF